MTTVLPENLERAQTAIRHSGLLSFELPTELEASVLQKPVVSPATR